VNDEPPVERRESFIDALEIFDDVRTDIHIVQMTDGIGRHGVLLLV
jgi:hypothetical protein